MPAADRLDTSLVCECEAVTAGEVRYAVNSLTVNNLVDLRRRTRVGMGTCRGTLRLPRRRAADALQGQHAAAVHCAAVAVPQRTVERRTADRSWGDALRESEFTSWVYCGLCGLEARADKEQEADDAI